MKSRLESFVGLFVDWTYVFKKGQPKPSYRSIEIGLNLRDMIKEFGLWQVLWGTDIFIGKLPFMKLLILANIIVWVVLGVIR